MVDAQGRRAELSSQERMFAAEVARARAAARVSQDWVGKQIGLSRSKVSEVCSGRYLPTRETVVLLCEVLGMDRDRTLRLWQDAREANDQRRRRDRLNGQGNVGWDRLPVLSAEILSLLRAQVRFAEELPYRLHGARQPTLSTVYVRQELGSEPEPSAPGRQQPPMSQPLVDERRGDRFDRVDTGIETVSRPTPPRLVMRAPARPVREALDANDHVLVTGGPGQGKSTLVLRLTADIARAWVGRDESAETVTAGDPPLSELVVPVRLPARVLAAYIELPRPDALVAALSVEYGSMLTAAVRPSTFTERVSGCRWLLLIDAVDEIADPEVRARFVRTMSSWAAESSEHPYRLLVTSRPLESGGLAPLHRAAARYELQPFDEAALRRFAVHWFDGDELAGRRFLDQIRQAHLDELVRVPLMATIAAIIFEQHGDRPLPDNRYDLYEEYLTYLASARERADEPGTVARRDRDLRPRLLEHLGATRFDADVSLAAAARTWLLANTTSRQRPVAWQTELLALLRDLGPLMVRGDDLQFLHHSFADHLAATARARQLPVPFDAEHPDWVQAIHTAQHGTSTRHALAILLHYTHLHPGQANQLISWLHDNSSGFQAVAAELLSQHAPVTESVLDAFLATARAWAKTSSGTQIFSQATHATHHPRLHLWLRNVMRDPEAKWNCRIEAANALCDRLRSHVDEATCFLRAAMDDATLDLQDRLAAAEGLAKAGAEQHDAAVRGLRTVLHTPSGTAYTARAAAVALADLGPDCHAEAVRTLREILADRRVSGRHHLQAAVGLAEIGADFHPEAVDAFHRIAGDTSLHWYERSQAALALGELRSIYLEQAADLLTGMTSERHLQIAERCQVAGAFAELGPEYVAEATSRLLAMLEEPFLEVGELRVVAEELAKTDPGHHATAAEQLRRVLADQSLTSNPRLWAAKALADLGAEYYEEAARELLLMATNPLAMEWERMDAAGKLASLGPRYRDKAVAVLRQKLTARRVDAQERISAAGELVALGTEFHEEAMAALRGIATDPSEEDGERVDAAVRLVGLHTGFEAEAVAITRMVLRNPGSSVYARMRAARQLATLSPTSRAESAAVLLGILSDATVNFGTRANAANSLANLGRQYSDAAAAGLRAMLDHAQANSFSYRQVTAGLAQLGAEFRTDAAGILREIAAAPTVDADRRWGAVRALVEFGQEYWETTESGLNAVLADPHTTTQDRQRAAELLARHSPRNRHLATRTLRAILGDPTAMAWIRGDAAKALARLGEQHLADAIDGLVAALAENATSVRTRAELAGVLAGMGHEHRNTARMNLRTMSAEQGTRPSDRAEAAWQLAHIDPEYRGNGIAILFSVLTDPSVVTFERCRAGERVIQLDENSGPAVISVLETMLTSPLTSPDDRLDIVYQLARLGTFNRAARTAWVLAVAQDPTASGFTRGQAAVRLRDSDYAGLTSSLEIERDLLYDHCVPVNARIIEWFNVHPANTVMRDEKIAALREVLEAPEFDADEWFDAQVLLAAFGGGFTQEAADALQGVVDETASSAAMLGSALHALGRLGSPYRTQALTLAENILTNPTEHPRRRLVAATTAIPLGGAGGPARDYLLATVRDPAASRRDRARAANTLGWLGTAEAAAWLLELSRDPKATPYTRNLAAAAAAKTQPRERTEMASILDALAGAVTTPPAARWRIAATLAELGEPQRQQAAARLREIMSNPGLSAPARTNAGKTLMKIQPANLHAVVDTLRAIAHAPITTAAQRMQTWAALGSLTRPLCDEAVAALREMLLDLSQSPTTRWRSAHAMVQLRRDTANEAASAVCEIIRSPDTPGHVRARAARVLARWSPLHRTEARRAMRQL